jgi:threonine dehydratase
VAFVDLADLAAARDRVGRHVPPTPTRRWPLLERTVGTETWVKHENHNPTGAFKVRGGVNYAARLVASGGARGLIGASRGNHSQSLAFAGSTYGVPVTIVVPEGNSPDKNAATEAYGAELVVHGADFQEASEHATTLAAERDLLLVPSFHPWLVEGVATYAAELHESVSGLDAVYVPVGMGSGICANIAVRDLLGLDTAIVGVVAERAPAYALSFAAGEPVATPAADTFVDGVACRTPDPGAVAAIVAGAARIVRVSEDQAAAAMALMYRATHNLAEPAGALALAGLLAERDTVAGQRVAVVHTGGNADFEVLARSMSADVPRLAP